MFKHIALFSLIATIFIISGCQSTPVNPVNLETVPITGQESVRTTPIDVLSKFIVPQAITPQAVDVASGNIFDNGGFEAGLTGWNACDSAAIQPSTDAYEGNAALKVNAGHCFYRSAEVSAGQDLVLSCYTKILSGSGWTGMGMGFADASWAELSQAPVAVITDTSYARFDSMATSPANAKYVSMWFYTDNPAVVDNCSLMLETEPPPPPATEGNLIDNGRFENATIDAVDGWSLCNINGNLKPEGDKIALYNLGCIYQGLSTADVVALAGKNYSFSCRVINTGGYASMTLYLGSISSNNRKVIGPSASPTTVQEIEITGTAPSNLRFADVGLYGEGDEFNNLKVESCSLTVDTTVNTQVENLLFNPYLTERVIETNGNYEEPRNWLLGCATNGGYFVASRVGTSQRLYEPLGSYRHFIIRNGTCLDQRLTAAARGTISGKNYSLACHVMNGGFMPYEGENGGYAALTISFDGQATTKIIPNISEYSVSQFIEITGVAPENAEDVYISLYSEGSLAVYDCSLSLTKNIIHISDWVLSNQVRSKLALTDSTPLNKTNLLGLRELNYSSNEINSSLGGTCCKPDIKSLQGIEFASNLQSLSLSGSKVTDFSPLYGLSDLENLGLGNSGLTNIDFLRNMTQVKELYFGNNNISLPRNNISDISVLLEMSNLSKVTFKNYNGGNVNALDATNQIAHEQVIQQLRARGVTVLN